MSKELERHAIVVVGGGPAGLAAAIGAYEAGERDILVLERDTQLGGILNQCIHNGFGLHTFKEELTGPEYAARYIARADELGIERRLGTMVMDISDDRVVTAVSSEAGITRIQAGAVILAMGCRERPRGALATPGYRPAGIYSAGTAQRLVNIEGQLPGRNVVILGSGDIGLIMARRMTFEGAHVQCVAEIMPYSGGLKRNIVQCLDDFGIPLLLSHTVTRIEGRQRVEAVWIAEVDERMRPIAGTEVRYPCDTLLLSVGLLPENELSREAGVELSPVTRGPEEAATAGASAARFVQGAVDADDAQRIPIVATDGVRYTVPSTVSVERMPEALTVRFRVGNVYRDHYVSVYLGDDRIQHRKKRVMAPGEMEQVTLKRAELLAHPDIASITVKLEEE